MQIIPGPRVDLIEPFPVDHASRAYRWLHCYRNIIESDLSPRTEEEFEMYLQQILPAVRSWGVIDKNNILGINHEAPLIGMLMVEPTNPWNGYLYLTGTRRAFGMALMTDAVVQAIEHLFRTEPSLLRISINTVAKKSDNMIAELVKQVGFKFEGYLPDMVVQYGHPKTLAHYGMTRRNWNEMTNPAVEQGVENNNSVEAPTAPAPSPLLS